MTMIMNVELWYYSVKTNFTIEFSSLTYLFTLLLMSASVLRLNAYHFVKAAADINFKVCGVRPRIQCSLPAFKENAVIYCTAVLLERT